ncbi:microtubule-associated protein CRIPT-domain-containing protein, partial [Aspergillus granulosus]
MGNEVIELTSAGLVCIGMGQMLTTVAQNKLLSSKAKNPYAAYSSSCDMCKTKTEQGRKFCQRCAYQKNACPMCGKSLSGKSSKDQPVVQGQKFNL